MPVYLVRLRPKRTATPKPCLSAHVSEENCPDSEAASTYFIGTFNELDLINLFWAVDEQLDPGLCEYVVLKTGRCLFLTEDCGDGIRFHYNERLRIDELAGSLKWRRIPHWSKGP